jgi:hypothetical protein
VLFPLYFQLFILDSSLPVRYNSTANAYFQDFFDSDKWQLEIKEDIFQ